MARSTPSRRLWKIKRRGAISFTFWTNRCIALKLLHPLYWCAVAIAAASSSRDQCHRTIAGGPSW